MQRILAAPFAAIAFTFVSAQFDRTAVLGGTIDFARLREEPMELVNKNAQERKRKMKKLMMICLAAIALGVNADDTWYLLASGSGKIKVDNVDIRPIVLTNMTYWGARNGTASGRTDRPTLSDHLVIADEKWLRIAGGNVLTAGSLTLGTDDSNGFITHDGQHPNWANNGLFLKRGAYRHNLGNTAFDVDGKITVLSAASTPFFFAQQQRQYANSTLTLKGAFSGDAGTGVVFGPRSAISSSTYAIATNMTFVVNNPSGYKGSIEVSSSITFADNSKGGTTLKLGSISTPGSISVINSGATLSPLSATDVVQASSVSLVSGCRLVFQCDAAGNAGRIEATDSLAVANGVEVRIDHESFLPAGRYTLLQGPSGSAFTTNNFTFLTPELACDFEVVDDGTFRSLVLAATNYVTMVKSDVFGKDTGSNFHSAITNAACWSDGRTPHPGATYIIPAGFALRTPMATEEDLPLCEFGGDKLIFMNGSRLLFYCANLSVGKFMVPYGASAEIFIGQGFSSSGASVGRLVADEIVVDGTLSLGAYIGKGLLLGGPLSGTGEVVMQGVDGTSSYTGSYSFGADNSAFTGRLRLSLHKQLQTQGRTNQTFHVYAATDFGGNRESFDYKAVTIERGGHLIINPPRGASSNNFSYTAPTNCGFYANGYSDMNVQYGVGNLIWPASLTLNGTLRKRGSGRLALGSPMKFITGGSLSATPTEGKNIIEWEGGRIQPLVCDAIDGCQLQLVSTSQNGYVHLKLAQDYSDPDLMRYGIKNTKTATPFSISDPAVYPKLPLEVEFPPTPADGTSFTVGLVTVSSTAADSVRAILPDILTRKIYKGYKQKAVEITENGMTTFAVEFVTVGFTIDFR